MAFVSDTDIANMAVSHVGSDSTIESLASDKSEEARQCRIWYDFSRQQILEIYDWNFARGRLGLALHGDVISETATDPMAGVWGFRYQYPEDCIKVRKMQNPNAPPDDASPFSIELSLNREQKTILTNIEDAVLVYTVDLEATELFSSAFVQAFSHLLASQIAFSLTGKRKVGLDQFNLYRMMLPTAMGIDANEQVDTPPRDADWIRARGADSSSGFAGSGSISDIPDANN